MIKQVFAKNRKCFIPFIMAGYPSIEDSTQAIIALCKIGADLIEIGLPFSDPVADGPINQNASQIALEQSLTLSTVFEQVKTLREQGYTTPILLFSYLNPIMAFGYDIFAKQARKAGINGILIVDLPPEEGYDFYILMKKNGLEIVLLAAPTTDPKRFKHYQKLDPSFIYYISRLAVTGVQKELDENLDQKIQRLRLNYPNKAIALGFGISTIKQAKTVATMADGVVVGSILVKTLGEQGIVAFKKLAQSFADTIHNTS